MRSHLSESGAHILSKVINTLPKTQPDKTMGWMPFRGTFSRLLVAESLRISQDVQIIWLLLASQILAIHLPIGPSLFISICIWLHGKNASGMMPGLAGKACFTAKHTCFLEPANPAGYQLADYFPSDPKCFSKPSSSEKPLSISITLFPPFLSLFL